MPERAIKPTSALIPNGCWKMSSVGTTPINPSGEVKNTMIIAEIERTCRMMTSSVMAIMIGNNGNIALPALPDSSIAPACSIRYPPGSLSMTGCSSFMITLETSGGCKPSAMSPRTVMVGVRSRRRRIGSSIRTSTSPTWDNGIR
ncbi:hypothetical protein D3C81_1203200 [compost metagenome]